MLGRSLKFMVGEGKASHEAYERKQEGTNHSTGMGTRKMGEESHPRDKKHTPQPGLSIHIHICKLHKLNRNTSHLDAR